MCAWESAKHTGFNGVCDWHHTSYQTAPSRFGPSNRVPLQPKNIIEAHHITALHKFVQETHRRTSAGASSQRFETAAHIGSEAPRTNSWTRHAHLHSTTPLFAEFTMVDLWQCLFSENTSTTSHCDTADLFHILLHESLLNPVLDENHQQLEGLQALRSESSAARGHRAFVERYSAEWRTRKSTTPTPTPTHAHHWWRSSWA